jgi:phosphoribosylglycinamide formyltransferase-1
MLVKKIVICFSGEGSNMQVLIQKLHQKMFGDFKIEVAAVITNKPDAKGIAKAKKLGVDVIMIDHTLYEKREDFDRKLVAEIEALKVDLVVLAGFMRILTPIFTSRIKAINIHPSLLPAFKGAKALERSYHDSEDLVGVTVHFVVQEVDGGEIIAQKSFDKSGMDFDSFKEKIHACEHAIFSEAVVKVIASSPSVCH